MGLRRVAMVSAAALVLAAGLMVLAGQDGPAALGAAQSVALWDPASGQWHLLYPNGTEGVFYFGDPQDTPLLGDWDCDGTDTVAMYRRSNGFIYLRNSNTFGVSEVAFFYGLADDIPLAGDWDGDGCDTFAIYRPSQGRVFIRNMLGTGVADYAYYFGNPGDRPFAGDFDGDGTSTVGLYRDTTGFVYFRNVLSTGVAEYQFYYGEPSDRIVAGDWDGDGDETVGIFRPGNARFYLSNANRIQMADVEIAFGEGGWLPAAGSFGSAPVSTTTSSLAGAGTTYYVRPDGGSPAQCTGTVDAAYPGAGGGRPCAWDHPFRAFPPGGSSRLIGGDVLVIGSGSYMMGWGAAGAEACDTDDRWGCHMPAIPSGSSSDRPTRILGDGWDDGCSSPPELWGTEGAGLVINLIGSDYVEVACLDVTDHSGCAADHSGGLACNRSGYPLGSWADTGVRARDSTGVVLRDLDIHGLAGNGVAAGRLTNWTVERVRVAANGWAGWDGDIEGEDANQGSLTFRHWTVEWNGCPESYPGEQPAGCWGQTAGGYGDGIGTGETGGIWLIEDSRFLHNTSDGLDLLYVRRPGSSVTIRRTIAAGNAGDQIKTSGPTHIENTVSVSNCGYFDGQPFTHHVDACRAGGSALAFNLRVANAVTVVNSTVTGQGDCLVIAECAEGSSCTGAESVEIWNTILIGHAEYAGGGDTTCLAWSPTGLGDPFEFHHVIVRGVKELPAPCPPNSSCTGPNPVADAGIGTFDGRLTAGSPAIDAGALPGAPANDIEGRLRTGPPDIGAYEYPG